MSESSFGEKYCYQDRGQLDSSGASAPPGAAPVSAPAADRKPLFGLLPPPFKSLLVVIKCIPHRWLLIYI